MLANQRKLYPLLFDCAAQSLLEFGRNRLKGDLGITAVLHTWGQKLDFHPHLHCIVTGGALSPDGKQWRSPKQRKFLCPVQAVAALFRGKFLAGLAQVLDAGELHLPDSELKIPANRARWFSLLYSKRWVLYAKRPLGGPQQVLSYLANYTHRVTRRFLMKALMLRPAPRLMHAFRQNPLGLSGYTAFFVSSAKPGLGHLGVIRAAYIGLMDLKRRKWQCLLTLQNLANVLDHLALAKFWQELNPTFQTCCYRSNPSSPQSALHRSRYFTHPSSNARGRLRPTIE